METLLTSAEKDFRFYFKSIASITNDYLFIYDFANNSIWISPNMAVDLGLFVTQEADLTENWTQRIHTRDRVRILEMYKDFISSGNREFTIEYQMLTANGTYIWVSVKSKIVYNKQKRPYLLLGSVRNLEYEDIDQITGLFKYSFSRDRFESNFQGRNDYCGEVMLLGIDDFTTINTLNNHNFGDSVLRITAQDIQKMLPYGMKLYRYEGDQFLITGIDLTRNDMLNLYNEIKEYARGTHCLDKCTYHFTVSAGLISCPEDAAYWADLERGAMISLRKAKKSGKNQCVQFTTELLDQDMNEQYISNCMADSIQRGFEHFYLLYQPICYVDSLVVHGAEALLRYQLPDGTQIYPDSFIPLLESSQMIRPVGLWVLEQALIICREWMKFIPDFVMNVNVSYIQLRDPSFCDSVMSLLQKYQIGIEHIVLELTESYFVSNDAIINSSLKMLHALRIQLAIDDFGTGYSTLARLSSLHANVVKIDKSFVQSLHKNNYHYDFMDSLIKLCHNLGLLVCVEGVETKEEWENIYLQGADHVQGYYVSRPIDDVSFHRSFLLQNSAKKLNLHVSKEKVEQHLSNDKELLFAMMNALPLCMTLWNRDYEILSCNEKAVSLYGAKDARDYIDHFEVFSQSIQPNGRTTVEMICKQIDRAFQEGECTFKWMHRDTTGNDLPTEVTTVRIPYQSDFIVASFTRDLRIETEINEKNKRFRMRLKALLDAAPLCLNVWNEHLKLIMCNHEAVKLFGLQNEQEYLACFDQLSPIYQENGKLSLPLSREKIKEAMRKGRIKFRWMHKNLKDELIPSEITLVCLNDLEDNGEQLIAGFTRDLRDQIRSSQIELTAAKRIRAVMDASPLVCILWNQQGDMVDCNQAAIKMFGSADREDLLHNADSIFPLYQLDGSLSMEKKVERFAETRRKGRIEFEWIYVNARHEPIPCEVTLVNVVIDAGGEDIVIAYSRDLRELKHTLEMNERLQRLANHDFLTGCLSRSYFMDLFEQRFQASTQTHMLTFSMFDIDDFKAVNDTYGHEAGDMVLKTVIQNVQKLLPVNAELGRYGGDEFMIFLDELNRTEVVDLMEHIVKQLSAVALNCRHLSFHITVSFGIAYQNEADTSKDDLLHRGDLALYKAKKQGGNRFVIL